MDSRQPSVVAASQAAIERSVARRLMTCAWDVNVFPWRQVPSHVVLARSRCDRVTNVLSFG
jgi:hypothetical protein